MDTNSAILAHSRQMPESLFVDFRRECDSHSIPYTVKLRSEQMYASLDWAIPAAVALFVAKPFLETILKKAADDAYPGLKRAATKLVTALFGQDASESRKHVSLLFAIYLQDRNGNEIKALFWEGVDIGTQHRAIDELFSLIADHYLGHASNVLSDRPREGERWGTLFIVFDVETG